MRMVDVVSLWSLLGIIVTDIFEAGLLHKLSMLARVYLYLNDTEEEIDGACIRGHMFA